MPQHPDSENRSDIRYAATDDGHRLPIIDVTNPAFAVTATDDELAAMSEQFVRESRSQQRMPAFLQRLLLRFFLRRSILGRGLIAASGTFLTGMNTYRLKLGPNNLGSDADVIDQRIAASFPAFAARLRLQDTARLLAEGLLPRLTAHAGQPLCLINIAGGPAADSLNALILLHAGYPQSLAGRPILVAVLDLDEQGPAFGGRALDALRAAGGPLSGLDIGFRHMRYDWSDASQLGPLLEQLHTKDAVCAISSEGGLFEYGSDGEIATNLQALHAQTAAGVILAGTVTREGELSRLSQGASRASTRQRTIDAFRHLAERGQWAVEQVIERPFSYNVRLVRLT